MSKALEFQGKSIEAALEKASLALNCPTHSLRYEVLAHGSSGIFGIVGVKAAKIKVLVDPDHDTPCSGSALKPASELEPDPDDQPKDRNGSAAWVADNQDPALEQGLAALQKIVDWLTEGATVQLKRQRERLIFTISGGQRGVLIGKRGQTLESIQYLLERMINKKCFNRLGVVVDVEGYLEQRKRNLRSLATRLAEKAKRINKPVTIGQMNAHDRRTVHVHLKDQKGVKTQSVGDGYYRKLMIFPNKQAEMNNRPDATKDK